MRTPPPSHLGALLEGLRLLKRHPWLALALAFLAMLLAQLGPALELAAGVGPNLILQAIFGFAGLLPLEMYFIPRLQAQLDGACPQAASAASCKPKQPVASVKRSVSATPTVPSWRT